MLSLSSFHQAVPEWVVVAVFMWVCVTLCCKSPQCRFYSRHHVGSCMFPCYDIKYFSEKKSEHENDYYSKKVLLEAKYLSIFFIFPPLSESRMQRKVDRNKIRSLPA